MLRAIRDGWLLRVEPTRCRRARLDHSGGEEEEANSELRVPDRSRLRMSRRRGVRSTEGGALLWQITRF